MATIWVCDYDRQLTHYCVVCADLERGRQCAQLVHAAERTPAPEGTYAVVLQVPDEAALLDLSARIQGLDHVLVREPDLGDRATAIGVHPRPREEVRRYFSRLKPLR